MNRLLVGLWSDDASEGDNTAFVPYFRRFNFEVLAWILEIAKRVVDCISHSILYLSPIAADREVVGGDKPLDTRTAATEKSHCRWKKGESSVNRHTCQFKNRRFRLRNHHVLLDDERNLQSHKELPSCGFTRVVGYRTKILHFFICLSNSNFPYIIQ